MAVLREKLWLIVSGLLVLSLVAGIVFFSMRRAQVQPSEILIRNANRLLSADEVYICGAVARPGIYPTRAGDTVTALISAAGISEGADTTHVRLYVPAKNEQYRPQKVDLNRADAWLLQALPGIGEGKARQIVEYRNKNGPYHSLDDLLKIQGFGNAILQKIGDFATIGD